MRITGGDKDFYGLPGPGGSPGMCPICGVNFLLEIILRKTVKSFRINLSEQTFFGHDKCIALLKSLDKDDRWWEKLPAISPFRREAERLGWGVTVDIKRGEEPDGKE